MTEFLSSAEPTKAIYQFLLSLMPTLNFFAARTQRLKTGLPKFTVTDYKALTKGTNCYFRFPIASRSAVPHAYMVDLLQFVNRDAFQIIVSKFNFESKLNMTY